MIMAAEREPDIGEVVRLLRRVLRRLDRLERRPQIVVNAAPTPNGPPSPAKPPARHSPDFRSAHWYGQDYRFTPGQAAAVRVLWQAWESGTPEVGQSTLLEAADSQQDRLVGLFRDNKGRLHPCWEQMIVSPRRGIFRLDEPA